MSQRIDQSPVVRWIEEHRADAKLAPIVDAAEAELTRLSGARKMPNGELTPLDMGINDVERMRKRIVSLAGGSNNANDQRLAAELNGVIDAMTEGKGGAMYREARAAFRAYADRYRNRALVRDLLSFKAGTTDPRIALESIAPRVASSSNEEIRHLYRVLESNGVEGRQAIRELQAHYINQAMEQTFGNVARNTDRQPIPSPAKLAAWIKVYDRNGRIEVLVGRKNAEVLRDMRDVLSDMHVAPPGAVNTSNTYTLLKEGASALLHGNPTGAAIRVKDAWWNIRNERQATRQIQDALRQPPQ